MYRTITKKMIMWTEKLRDISAYGLTFCKDPYDLENYRKIQDISIEMTDVLSCQPIEELEILRKRIIGRPTPLMVVDAAVLNKNDELLLIQRTDNEEWTFPGGYLDTGEIASEAVTRETMEEVGIKIKPLRLIGVYDSRKLRKSPLNQINTLLFLCQLIDESQIKIDFNNHIEVLNKKWLSKESISSMELDPCIRLRIDHVFQSLSRNFQTYFDS